MLVVVIAGCLWLRADPGPLDRFDAWITDVVITLRTGWLNALARQVHTVGSRVGFAALGLLLVLATAWFRRWRHLVMPAGDVGDDVAHRPRPQPDFGHLGLVQPLQRLVQRLVLAGGLVEQLVLRRRGHRLLLHLDVGP